MMLLCSIQMERNVLARKCANQTYPKTTKFTFHTANYIIQLIIWSIYKAQHIHMMYNHKSWNIIHKDETFNCLDYITRHK